MELKKVTRQLMVAALSVYALALTACSTPAVPYSDPDSPDVSWEAYQDCINSLPAGSNANVCNNVGTMAASSQTNYINSGLYVDSNGNVMSSTSGATVGSSGPTFRKIDLEKSYAVAYKAYLETVDAKDRAEMTAQWRAIAASNHQ